MKSIIDVLGLIDFRMVIFDDLGDLMIGLPILCWKRLAKT